MRNPIRSDFSQNKVKDPITVGLTPCEKNTIYCIITIFTEREEEESLFDHMSYNIQHTETGTLH